MVTSVSELKILEGIKGRVGLNLCHGVVLLHRPPSPPPRLYYTQVGWEARMVGLGYLLRVSSLY